VVEKPNKFQAALLAGIIFGVLSSIPFVNFVNLCCCLWIVAGGAVAARTLINRSPVFPVTSGEGALVGLLSGVISSLVYLVVGIPLSLLLKGSNVALTQKLSELVNDPNFRTQMEEMIRQNESQSGAAQLAGGLIFWLICSVLAVGFGALGGVIGVAMFEKRKGQPMPPMQPPGPPPGYTGYPPAPGGQPPTY
jgi:hypothetical protein